MTEPTTLAQWRKLANLRQYMLNKVEAKNRALEAKLLAANTRLAFYDQREAA